MDLRRSLGTILDAASAGERFVIERDHRPLAVLVSVEEGLRLDESADERKTRILASLDRTDEFRARMAILYPVRPGEPDAVTALRDLRARDDHGPAEQRSESRDG